MALLPFKTKDENGKDLYVAPLIKKGQDIPFIPYAERPGSPQESFTNGVFRARRTFDVPWHLRWHFMYAMLGDSGLTQDGKIERRIPHGYYIRDFSSIYDKADKDGGDPLGEPNTLPQPWLYANAIDSIEPVAFDGKDSLYIMLTLDQMAGDIANAGKPPAHPDTNTPVSGSPKAKEVETKKKSRSPSGRNAKSFGEENSKRYANAGIRRLRYMREQLSKHQIQVVYKDIIKEIKKQEKLEILQSEATPEVKKENYKNFVRALKQENSKPLSIPKKAFYVVKEDFGGGVGYPDIIDGSDPLYVEEGVPPNTFPESLFAADGPFDGKLDQTAVAKYKLARITVTYENVQYRIRESNASSYMGLEELVNDCFMTFYRLPTAEVLSLPFGAFRFFDKDPEQRYVVTGSNMRLESQEEIMITWHGVPFVPDAVRTHIGKINDNWFPIGHVQVADNEEGLNPNKRVFAAPGTLLLTNVELKPYKGFFSRRLYDINYKFKYFHASEDGELAYSEELFIKASHPCDPMGSLQVCQKMAKGHNFFLKFKYFNPKTGKAEDTLNSGQSSGWNYKVSGECALSGQAPSVYEKCSDPLEGTSYIRQYITSDGCPSGNPIYQSVNFDELFLTPADPAGCDGSIAGNVPTSNVVSGSEPLPLVFTSKADRTRRGTSFQTTVNDHLKAKMVKPSLQKPPTKNPRLRK